MEPSCLVFRPQWSLLSFNCWFKPGLKISGIERLSGRLATARDVARSYRCEARDYYRRWSPSSTLRHPEVAPQVSQAHFPTVETSLEHLDLATIIRMSQTVAGELLLDRLIETLMTIGRVAHDLAPQRMRFEERDGAAGFVYSPAAPSESVAPEHAEDVVVAIGVGGVWVGVVVGVGVGGVGV